MTDHDRPTPQPLIRPFPRPGPRLQLAYRELDLAANGTEDQQRALGTIGDLPRPWAPATCTNASLRAELWTWLDAVVTWLNHELVFDTDDVIPACWPMHAHLIHELAVLADLRRRADRALTSDILDEWHRYALPSFLDRMRHRVGEHCNDQHAQIWPAAGRFTRHLDGTNAANRRAKFMDDVMSLRDPEPRAEHRGSSVHIIDAGTGELLE